MDTITDIISVAVFTTVVYFIGYAIGYTIVYFAHKRDPD